MAPSIDIPFEYCALRYLLQWERSEKSVHKAISGKPTATEIRSALRLFQVARNFKGLKDDANAEVVRNALAKVKDINKWNVEKRVVGLAETLEKEFGQFTLSAASKLLWLKFQWPVVLYDSRALRSLRDMGSKIDAGDYHAFVESWHERYKDSSKDIRNAVMRLNKLRPFLPGWHVSDQQLLRLARHKWFRERVYDIYLWEAGGEG